MLMVEEDVFVAYGHHIIVEGPRVNCRRVLAYKQGLGRRCTVLACHRLARFFGLAPGEGQIACVGEGIPAVNLAGNPRFAVICAETIVVCSALIPHVGATLKRPVMGEPVPFREHHPQYTGSCLPLDRPVVHCRKVCRREVRTPIGCIRAW